MGGESEEVGYGAVIPERRKFCILEKGGALYIHTLVFENSGPRYLLTKMFHISRRIGQ